MRESDHYEPLNDTHRQVAEAEEAKRRGAAPQQSPAATPAPEQRIELGAGAGTAKAPATHIKDSSIEKEGRRPEVEPSAESVPQRPAERRGWRFPRPDWGHTMLQRVTKIVQGRDAVASGQQERPQTQPSTAENEKQAKLGQDVKQSLEEERARDVPSRRATAHRDGIDMTDAQKQHLARLSGGAVNREYRQAAHEVTRGAGDDRDRPRTETSAQKEVRHREHKLAGVEMTEAQQARLDRMASGITREFRDAEREVTRDQGRSVGPTSGRSR